MLEINHKSFITYFNDKAVNGIPKPERFTFPFFYQPHPLTRIAVAELQHYLETDKSLEHNFGLESDDLSPAIGKMFGVLVVADKSGRLGYLSAFSGKLAGSNVHEKFVPPVFDMLVEDSFFIRGQELLNEINKKVKDIETDDSYLQLAGDLERLSGLANKEIITFKTSVKHNKAARKKLRESNKNILGADEYATFEADLIKQSLHDKHRLNLLVANWDEQLKIIRTELSGFESRIAALKQDRREKSAALQQQLFDQYNFLNIAGETKSLHDIFSETVFVKPPAAAGECATPKLLQFAFLNGYKPVAMAEFWWGAAPKSEIKQHKQFYPACTGKCKPILGHMLKGMLVDDDPLLNNELSDTIIDIVYQDDDFIVVNKPAGLRSVPGVNVQDSVYTRVKGLLKNVEPLIIHRLDMGTSGLLVLAKTKAAHKFIQAQFLKRTVIKRYTALLSKKLSRIEGEIDLPLKPDLLNRPRQLVCFEEGKKAISYYKVVETANGVTKVHFWPHTGRTHQLRMHAAHESGLNAPIVGDDLYGTGAKRLYLHAAFLEFIHPETKKKVSFSVDEDFDLTDSL